MSTSINSSTPTAASGSTSFSHGHSNNPQKPTSVAQAALGSSAQEMTSPPRALREMKIEATSSDVIDEIKCSLWNAEQTNSQVVLLDSLKELKRISGFDFRTALPELYFIDLSSLSIGSLLLSDLKATGIMDHPNLRYVFLPRELEPTAFNNKKHPKSYFGSKPPEIFFYDETQIETAKEQLRTVLNAMLDEWEQDCSITGNKKEAKKRILECFESFSPMIELNLSQLQLSKLPHALRLLHLKRITSIDLSHNELTSYLDISNFKHLIEINLSFNDLDYIDQNLFPSKLKKININNNKKISSPPDLSKLEFLKRPLQKPSATNAAGGGHNDNFEGDKKTATLAENTSAAEVSAATKHELRSCFKQSTATERKKGVTFAETTVIVTYENTETTSTKPAAEEREKNKKSMAIEDIEQVIKKRQKTASAPTNASGGNGSTHSIATSPTPIRQLNSSERESKKTGLGAETTTGVKSIAPTNASGGDGFKCSTVTSTVHVERLSSSGSNSLFDSLFGKY